MQVKTKFPIESQVPFLWTNMTSFLVSLQRYTTYTQANAYIRTFSFFVQMVAYYVISHLVF